MNNLRRVPELSLLSFVNGSKTERITFVDQLFSGLKEYGFIILEDHTLESSVIKNAYDDVARFYALETNEKMKYSLSDGGQRGYTAFGVEHAKDHAAPDLKEFWHVGRELADGHRLHKFYPQNIWPSQIPSFKKHLSTLYNELDKTSHYLLEAIGMALDVEKDYFKNMICDGNSILRAIHYPAIPKDAPKNSVRAAAHEDINLITILMGATASGLELLDRDGTWLPVETKEGQLVVDTGDMLSRITNEVLPATTHRVVNPEDSSTERYSMPFFVHPHPEAELKCLKSCLGSGAKYPPINSHDFLTQRLVEIGLKQG